MSEPLFLQSVMQEKIWGGTHLRDVFGYDIPSDHVGEYWAISAHPNGVSTIKNGRLRMVAMPVKPWMFFMQSIVSCSVIVRNLSFLS